MTSVILSRIKTNFKKPSDGEVCNKWSQFSSSPLPFSSHFLSEHFTVNSINVALKQAFLPFCLHFIQGKESCCFHFCIFLASMMHGLGSRATASPYQTSLKFRKGALLPLAACCSAGARLGQLTASSYEEKALSSWRARAWQGAAWWHPWPHPLVVPEGRSAVRSN